ncbi:kinase-like protein [Sistotremastrum niveocremeum HHB9708]|uniref:non-specific serine/threonine protein kinase n=1 Tax=Sistotremastrum niveocremeum HHB9708 TaxID=1314777 RepID=A0A164NXI1_9AGAM|nr:kinase-like protein [Sistotremastrum niveocremeum HHB9708]
MLNETRGQKFYFKCAESEDLANYTEGGYHPIHLGDVIPRSAEHSKAKYRIIYKLGHNRHSTMWLGICMEDTAHYVVLDVGISRSRNRDNELEIIASASSSSTQDQGCQNILKILDQFKITGPNGCHTVFVSELMWTIDHREIRLRARWYGCHSIMSTRTSADYHSAISHKAFFLKMRKTKPDQFKSLRARMGAPDCRPVLMAGMASEPHRHPKYACTPAHPLDALPSFFIDVGVEDVCILLSCFADAFQTRANGAGRFSDSGNMCMPPDMIIFQKPCSPASDIWALGCTLYYMITGSLIAVPGSAAQEQLKSTVDNLGPLPIDWWNASPTKPYELSSSVSSSITWQKLQEHYLEIRVDRSAGTQSPQQDADDLVQLIRSMLSYDPETRPTIRDCLNHPWFACIV